MFEQSEIGCKIQILDIKLTDWFLLFKVSSNVKQSHFLYICWPLICAMQKWCHLWVLISSFGIWCSSYQMASSIMFHAKKKKKVALGKRTGPTADNSVNKPDWRVWFDCDYCSMVNLCTAVERALMIALWRVLLSGVSLVCSCRGSPSAGKDSHSSPRWPLHQTPALCLLLYCTQTNAPTTETYFSLVWWPVRVLETTGSAGVKSS